MLTHVGDRGREQPELPPLQQRCAALVEGAQPYEVARAHLLRLLQGHPHSCSPPSALELLGGTEGDVSAGPVLDVPKVPIPPFAPGLGEVGACTVLSSLVTLALRAGRADEAQASLDQALALVAHGASGPGAPHALALHSLQADVYMTSGQDRALGTWLRVHRERAEAIGLFGWWYAVAVRALFFHPLAPDPSVRARGSTASRMEADRKHLQSMLGLALTHGHDQVAVYLHLLQYHLAAETGSDLATAGHALAEGRRVLLRARECAAPTSMPCRVLEAFLLAAEVAHLFHLGHVKQAHAQLSILHGRMDAEDFEWDRATGGLLVGRSDSTPDTLPTLLLDPQRLACFVYYLSGMCYLPCDVNRAQKFLEEGATFWQGEEGIAFSHLPWGGAMRVRMSLVLASLHLVQGRPEACLEQLYVAAHLAHQLPGAWQAFEDLIAFHFAAYYHAQGEEERAALYYEDILARAPEPACTSSQREVRHLAGANLALLRFAQGRGEEACALVATLAPSPVLGLGGAGAGRAAGEVGGEAAMADGIAPVDRAIGALLSALCTLAQGQVSPTKAHLLRSLRESEALLSNPLKCASLLVLAQLFVGGPPRGTESTGDGAQGRNMLRTAFTLAQRHGLWGSARFAATSLLDRYALAQDVEQVAAWRAVLAALP